MARKKAEVQLLREVESQEEWEDIMSKEGVWVVDVYQEWSGPCDAMTSNFRRIKNELGDDLLHFAMAKADTIESLEKYRGSCEPCFLYFAGGVLVAYVHGANAPLILRTLTEQLAQEHKVIDGTAERKEVKDPFVASREAEEKEEEEMAEEDTVPYRHISADEETVEEGYTVALIKPNVVAEGKVDEVLAEMAARGIKVIAQENRHLTEEEAREFYRHLEGESYYEDLVTFMCSGPSCVLVLTKGQTDDSIIKDWREMLGPPNVEEAKEQAPESLRAKYGASGLANALHGSDSKDTAARELAFFFPDMSAPTIIRKKSVMQRTLALIRPDAFAQNRDAILERIAEAGFKIAMQREITLTREQVEDFYKEHVDQPYFEELIDRMTIGPLLALGLAREDAVSAWRSMLGPPDLEVARTEAPESLRAQFSVDDVPINQLHGSSDPQSAKEEIEFFFPVENTVAVIKPDAIGTKDAIIDKIHEAGFRIAAQKETTITREIAETIYEDQRDQPYFNDLVEHMCSGPTMFMVLSREGAVEGWRQVIGPKDPEEAKQLAPDSIRAQFGLDLMSNAVHGSLNKEQVEREIKVVFGELAEEGNEEADETEKVSKQKSVTTTQPLQEKKGKEQEQPTAEDKAATEPKQEDQAATESKPEDKTSEEPAPEEKTSEEPKAEVTETEPQVEENAAKADGAAEEAPQSEKNITEQADDQEDGKDPEAESSHSGIDLNTGARFSQADESDPRLDTADDNTGNNSGERQTMTMNDDYEEDFVDEKTVDDEDYNKDKDMTDAAKGTEKQNGGEFDERNRTAVSEDRDSMASAERAYFEAIEQEETGADEAKGVTAAEHLEQTSLTSVDKIVEAVSEGVEERDKVTSKAAKGKGSPTPSNKGKASPTAKQDAEKTEGQDAAEPGKTDEEKGQGDAGPDDKKEDDKKDDDKKEDDKKPDDKGDDRKDEDHADDKKDAEDRKDEQKDEQKHADDKKDAEDRKDEQKDEVKEEEKADGDAKPEGDTDPKEPAQADSN